VFISIWIAVSLLLLIRLIIRFALGYCLVARSTSIAKDVLREMTEQAKTLLSLRSRVACHATPSISSPVVWCWSKKPVLLIPESCASEFGQLDWGAIVCHELAHFRRRDHISMLIADLLICCVPWHPLLWWTRQRLLCLSEQACDDWAMVASSGSTRYARTLLELAPQGKALLVSAVVNTRAGLDTRVRRIIEDRCASPHSGVRWTLIVAALAICVVVGIAFAQPRPAAPENKGAGAFDETLKQIVASLRAQESLLKSGLVLHYTITIKPPEAAIRIYKELGGTETGFEVHDVEAILSGSKMWAQEKRFGADGKPTLTESFAWNGTNGQRLITSEKTGVKKGWNNYNPSSRRNNPTCTQNILLILGLLGTAEQSLAAFIANHQAEIELSQKGSEVLLSFSVLNAKLDYSLVLDPNHAFWPKQITQIHRNATENGVDLGDVKFEYRNIEFGRVQVNGVDVFYPKKMQHISYIDPKHFGLDKETSGTSGELHLTVVDEIAIQSIRFDQDIPDDQFQLGFPEDTLIY